MAEAVTRVNLAPLVSVIVVAYNGQADLAECLSALCADESPFPREILIIDNASGDDSAAIADRYAAQYPFVKSLKSPVNRGYAGGVNLGLAQARGVYVAVLNPDVIVTPGWLTRPVEFLQAHPAVGAVNPLILLYDDEERINAAGQDVTVTGLGFNRWLGQPRSRAGSGPLSVSGLQGSAVIMRRAVLDQVGGWDDSGFMYHEDVELSWLLQLMGYDLFCLPEAVVRHKYHLTMYPEKLFLLERNRWAMLLANLAMISLLVLAPFLLFTELLMWGYCLWRGWGFIRAKAASYGWIARQGPLIAARRRRIRAVRRRTDWQVLMRLRWGYAWDQFLTLGRERGRSRRQPEGSLPVKIGETL